MEEGLRSANASQLEVLWCESIAPQTEDLRAAFEVVLRAMGEPILAVETKAQIQGAARAVLDKHDLLRAFEEPGYVPNRYDFCEVFPFDLRVTTGTQAAPLMGSGHRVGLRREPNGAWSIAEVEIWMS